MSKPPSSLRQQVLAKAILSPVPRKRKAKWPVVIGSITLMLGILDQLVRLIYMALAVGCGFAMSLPCFLLGPSMLLGIVTLAAACC